MKKNSINSLMYKTVDSIQDTIHQVGFPCDIEEGGGYVFFLLRVCNITENLDPIIELSRHYNHIFSALPLKGRLTLSAMETIIRCRWMKYFRVVVEHYEHCIASSLTSLEVWVSGNDIMALVSKIKCHSGFSAALKYLREEVSSFRETERLTVDELIRVFSQKGGSKALAAVIDYYRRVKMQLPEPDRFSKVDLLKIVSNGGGAQALAGVLDYYRKGRDQMAEVDRLSKTELLKIVSNNGGAQALAAVLAYYRESRNQLAESDRFSKAEVLKIVSNIGGAQALAAVLDYYREGSQQLAEVDRLSKSELLDIVSNNGGAQALKTYIQYCCVDRSTIVVEYRFNKSMLLTIISNVGASSYLKRVLSYISGEKDAYEESCRLSRAHLVSIGRYRGARPAFEVIVNYLTKTASSTLPPEFRLSVLELVKLVCKKNSKKFISKKIKEQQRKYTDYLRSSASARNAQEAVESAVDSESLSVTVEAAPRSGSPVIRPSASMSSVELQDLSLVGRKRGSASQIVSDVRAKRSRLLTGSQRPSDTASYASSAVPEGQGQFEEVVDVGVSSMGDALLSASSSTRKRRRAVGNEMRARSAKRSRGFRLFNAQSLPTEEITDDSGISNEQEISDSSSASGYDDYSS